MKCAACGYEFLEDYQTDDNKKVGDEDFISIDGCTFEVSTHPWDRTKKVFLYACPKCNTVQMV